MADNELTPRGGQANPLLPRNADYDNRVNSSGSTREAVADAVSRGVDDLSDRDDEAHLAAMQASARSVDSFTDPYANSADLYGSRYPGGRYYSPAEGRIHLSGLFADRDSAEDAVNQLERLGVPRADISVILRDEAETRDFAVANDVEVGSKAGEGAGTGSILGGTVGAILGALAATATSIVVPGVGILIAGPIAGALAGAGAGGLTGGLLGALIGAGIPEETARTYEAGLHGGGVVVVADVPASLEAEARSILGTSY